ncbi:MAG: hypothetical protein NTY51_10065 [Deltaproteobacteria bacterium]|nr:hypothetical protein [Deltaproteobacteria bacterium]
MFQVTGVSATFFHGQSPIILYRTNEESAQDGREAYVGGGSPRQCERLPSVTYFMNLAGLVSSSYQTNKIDFIPRFALGKIDLNCRSD